MTFDGLLGYPGPVSRVGFVETVDMSGATSTSGLADGDRRAMFVRLGSGDAAVVARRVQFVVGNSTGNMWVGIYTSTEGSAPRPLTLVAATTIMACPSSGLATVNLETGSGSMVTQGMWACLSADTASSTFRHQGSGVALQPYYYYGGTTIIPQTVPPEQALSLDSRAWWIRVLP